MGGALPDDFRVGEWLVQTRLNRLSRGATSTRIEPRVMDLLRVLAESAGDVVSKRELLDSVWAVAFVDESVLSRAIARLRRALGDDARQPTFIETVPKRGYRLKVTVERAGVPRADVAEFVLAWDDRELPLTEGQVLIGRAPDVAVRLDSPWASRHHARLVVERGRVVLTDLDSRNGTFVRGERIEGPTELQAGDSFTIGPKVLTLQRVSGSATTLTQL